MAVNNPYAAYQQNSINTSSPGELTLMLYNGCLKFIGQAKQALDEKDFEKKNTAIQKAQKIIREFMVTLNMEIPMSKDLMSMYDYLNRRLMDANIKNDPEALLEVEGFVTELRDTWKQAVQIQRQKTHGAGNQA